MTGRKLIQDAFTSLPLSRQRKWQLRRRKEGRCIECGRAAATVMMCDLHSIKRALTQLEARGVTSGPRRGKWLVRAGLR